MTNRRGFFRSLLAVVVAPFLPAAIKAATRSRYKQTIKYTWRVGRDAVRLPILPVGMKWLNVDGRTIFESRDSFGHLKAEKVAYAYDPRWLENEDTSGCMDDGVDGKGAIVVELS